MGNQRGMPLPAFAIPLAELAETRPGENHTARLQAVAPALDFIDHVERIER